MSRQVCIGLAAILTLVDVVIHLRRSLLPDGNPFGSSLHQQFLLYCVVAFVLVVGLLGARRWLGDRAWIASAAMVIWQLGAIGVWLLAYHAPNPPGLVPDEGYISKILEALVILVLLPTLWPAARAKQSLS
jgi:hypothetical protein